MVPRGHRRRQLPPLVYTPWQTETGRYDDPPRCPGSPTASPGSAMMPAGNQRRRGDRGRRAWSERLGATSSSRSRGRRSCAPSGATTTASGTPTGRATRSRATTSPVMARRRDEDGDLWLLGRVDDVMNVSGHRLSTTEIESALVSHPKVAEAAVVGANDPDHRAGGVRLRDPARVGPRGGRDRLRRADHRSASTSPRRSASSPGRVRSWSYPRCRRPGPGRSCAACWRDVAEHREIGDVTTLADSKVMDLIEKNLSTRPPTRTDPSG